MIFKAMPREAVLKALEGQVDILTPELQRHQEYFKNLTCPHCQGSVVPVLDPKHLFRENAILPNYMAECTNCKCQFEPYTKIEVQLPKEPVENLAPAEEDLLSRGPR